MASRAPQIVFYEAHANDCFADPYSDARADGGGGYRNAAKALRRWGYDVKTVKSRELWRWRSQLGVEPDVLCLVASKYSGPLSAQEVDSIQSWVEKGGRLLLLGDSRGQVETGKHPEPNLTMVSDRWGVTFNKDLLWDTQRISKADDGWRERVAVEVDGDENPVLNDVSCVWYWGCTLSIGMQPPRVGSNQEFAIRASHDSFSGAPATNEDEEHVVIKAPGGAWLGRHFEAPPILVALSSVGKGGKVLAMGGCYTFNNDALEPADFGVGGDHLQLLSNIFEWLALDLPESVVRMGKPSVVVRFRSFFRRNYQVMFAFALGMFSSMAATKANEWVDSVDLSRLTDFIARLLYYL